MRGGQVTVIIGGQWGDEGKGKLVDLLANSSNVVCRCQGGDNAGHTVMEIDESINKGLTNIKSRLRISDRCHLVFDIHQMVDHKQEEFRGSASIGTTKKGIGPTYASKINRNGLRMCDLMGDWDNFVTKYNQLVQYVKFRYPTLETDVDKTLKEMRMYKEKLSGMVCDTISLIHSLRADPKNQILIECAQSCMLDIDFGSYPHVTSSNCSIGGVCTGLGISPKHIGSVYGVIKAYTTRVGSGAFPTELMDDIGELIQTKGKEFGTTTGRKRRIGWLDMVVVRYSHLVNQFDALALTKLDILDDLDEIKIGRTYIDPVTKDELPQFPADSSVLDRVQVVYETLPGWKCSTFNCQKFDDLPAQAQLYVETVERLASVPVRWVGTGPSRDSMLDRSA